MTLTLPSKQTLALLSLLVISLVIRLFFMQHTDLWVEEAYYWNYATHLDWSYLDHPPMVAVLIKASTAFWGLNEFGVRCPALICWGISLYYSYRYAELIQKNAGRYALVLLSVLPFFFCYALIMTPDMPLMACWSATLYYLHRALCLNQARAWYGAGIALGLGLLSKYSMLLLVFSTLGYVLSTAQTRCWLRRKEPYLALAIAILFFTPVIYWNSQHDWISFGFQSTRRIQGPTQSSLLEFTGLLICFLTPQGLISGLELLRPKSLILAKNTHRLICYQSLLPLGVFLVFSLSREIKSNWLGPCLLGLIPWLAYAMHAQKQSLKAWYQTAWILLPIYGTLLFCLAFGQPQAINRLIFNKMISWDQLSQDVLSIAEQEGTIRHRLPIIVPLDRYSIAAELNFYQAKHHKAKTPHISGAEALGYPGLMFAYWDPKGALNHQLLLLIAKTPDALKPRSDLIPLSPIKSLWGLSQGLKQPVRKFYYQVVLKS